GSLALRGWVVAHPPVRNFRKSWSWRRGHRLLPFAGSAWRSSGLLFLCLRSVAMPGRHRTDLGIVRDKFSTPPQTPAALLSADPVSVTNRPVVRELGQARRAKRDACRECLPHLPSVVTNSRRPLSCPRCT